jgi:hypothetical protein
MTGAMRGLYTIVLTFRKYTYTRKSSSSAMLLALLKRVDAFLEGQETVYGVQGISCSPFSWPWPSKDQVAEPVKEVEPEIEWKWPIEHVIFWRWPRFTRNEDTTGWEMDATQSPDICRPWRIQEVYVIEEDRRCYITYRCETYKLSQPLPADVDLFSVWDMTEHKRDLSAVPLRIGKHTFRLEKVYKRDGLPWIVKESGKIHRGYTLTEIENKYKPPKMGKARIFPDIYPVYKPSRTRHSPPL